MSWGFYALAALWLGTAVYDFVVGRPYLFSAVMALAFVLLGTAFRIVQKQRPKL